MGQRDNTHSTSRTLRQGPPARHHQSKLHTKSASTEWLGQGQGYQASIVCAPTLLTLQLWCGSLAAKFSPPMVQPSVPPPFPSAWSTVSRSAWFAVREEEEPYLQLRSVPM